MALEELEALDTETDHAILISGRLSYLPNESYEATQTNEALIEQEAVEDEMIINYEGVLQ